LLISPISWDHHWVWIVPAVTVLAHYGTRARGRLRWAWFSGGALIVALFGAWPGFLWGQPTDLGAFSEGLIWAPPNTAPGTFARLGDRPWYAEYHWQGFQLIVGNVYVLSGLVLLLVTAGWVGLTAVTRRQIPADAITAVSATSAVGR
jgi:hypothetical protein